MSGPGGVDDRQVGEGQASSLPSRSKRGRRELPESASTEYGGRRVKSRKPVEPEEREEQVAAPLLQKRSRQAAETSADLSTKRVKKGKAGASFSELEPAIYLRQELPKLARSLELRAPELAQQLLSACNSMSSEEAFYKALGPFFDSIRREAVVLGFDEESQRCESLLTALYTLQGLDKTASLTSIDALQRAVHDRDRVRSISYEIAHSPQSEIDDLIAHVTDVCAELSPEHQTHEVVYLIKSIPRDELSRARGDIVSLCREVENRSQFFHIRFAITEIPESERREALSKIAEAVHKNPQGIVWDQISPSLGIFPEDLRAKMLPQLINLFQGLDNASAADVKHSIINPMVYKPPSFFVEQVPDLLTCLSLLREARGVEGWNIELFHSLIEIPKEQRANVVKQTCQLLKDLPEFATGLQYIIKAIKDVAPVERQKVLSIASQLTRRVKDGYTVGRIIGAVALIRNERKRRDVAKQALLLFPFGETHVRDQLVKELAKIDGEERQEVVDLSYSFLKDAQVGENPSTMVTLVAGIGRKRLETYTAFASRLADFPDVPTRVYVLKALANAPPKARERIFSLLQSALERVTSDTNSAFLRSIWRVSSDVLEEVLPLLDRERNGSTLARALESYNYELTPQAQAYVREHPQLIQGVESAGDTILWSFARIPAEQLDTFITPLLPVLEGLHLGVERALMIDVLFNLESSERGAMQNDLQQLFGALTADQRERLYDSLQDVAQAQRPHVLRYALPLLQRARTAADVETIIATISNLSVDERERILSQPQVQDAASLRQAYSRLQGFAEHEVEEQPLGVSYQITAIPGEIEKYPEQYLDMLTRDFTPNRNNLSVVYEGQVGIDAGGLGRTFVSELFSSLVNKMGCKEIGKSGLFRPVLHMRPDGQEYAYSEEDKKCNVQLGQMLMFCLNAARDYPTGVLFDEGVFVALLGFSEALLQQEFTSLDPQKPEVFNELLTIFEKMNAHIGSELQSVRYMKMCLEPLPKDPEERKAGLEVLYSIVQYEEGVDRIRIKDPKELEAHIETMQKALRNLIFRTILQPNLAPLFEMAKGMSRSPFSARHSWQSLHALQPSQLSERIQGVVTPQAIIAKLQIDQRVPAEKQQWLKNWITTTSDEKRKLFLAAITGSKALGTKRITFNLAPHENSPIYYHTCFNEVDFPFNGINSASTLASAIENSLIGLTYDRS